MAEERPAVEDSGGDELLAVCRLVGEPAKIAFRTPGAWERRHGALDAVRIEDAVASDPVASARAEQGWDPTNNL